MFIPFARPLFACHSNTARPRTFLSVYKFSGDNIFVHLSPFTQSQQPVFQINDGMVLANHFSVEIEFFHRIVEPFHCQLAFRMECIGIWKNIFPFTDPSPVLFFCCLTFKHFIIIRLKLCCCASVYMLRGAYIAESCGQSTSHSRILSRYSP